MTAKKCPHCDQAAALAPHRCSTDKKGQPTHRCDWGLCTGCGALIGPYGHHHKDHEHKLCPAGTWPRPKETP
jgi:hypothetical protein